MLSPRAFVIFFFFVAFALNTVSARPRFAPFFDVMAINESVNAPEPETHATELPSSTDVAVTSVPPTVTSPANLEVNAAANSQASCFVTIMFGVGGVVLYNLNRLV